MFGVWSILGKTFPQALMHINVILANLGGVFNLIVYSIIRKRYSRESRRATTECGTKNTDSNKTTAQSKEPPASSSAKKQKLSESAMAIGIDASAAVLDVQTI